MASPTTSVLDTFTDTNGTDLSAHGGWSAVTDFFECEIQSNQCTGVGGDVGLNMWSTISSGADTEAYITINTQAAATWWYFLFARVTTLVGSTVDGYYLEITKVAGTDEWRVFEWLNGSGTQNGATATTEVADGGQIFFLTSGTTLSGHYNGTEVLSRTDATYGSAGYFGLGFGDNDVRGDSFGGGQVVTAGANPKGPLSNPFAGPLGGPI